MVQEKKPSRVYIVDDSLTIRAMMDTLIAKDRHLEICGMAADAETALENIDYFLPDIILLDIALPGMDGLALLDAIRRHPHHMKVIIVSSSAKHATAICGQSFRKGAIACFDKSKLIVDAKEFIALLDEVSEGELHAQRYSDHAVTLPAIYY